MYDIKNLSLLYKRKIAISERINQICAYLAHEYSPYKPGDIINVRKLYSKFINKPCTVAYSRLHVNNNDLNDMHLVVYVRVDMNDNAGNPKVQWSESHDPQLSEALDKIKEAIAIANYS